MKFLVYFISLVTINILPKTNSQGSQKVPGPSSCSYYAFTQEDCGEPTVPTTDLPKEATSIFYDGLIANASLNVSFNYPGIKNDEHMKNLLSSGKPVFVFYTRLEFNTAISSISQDGGENATTEMSNLKKFLEPYKDITGIVLTDFTMSADNTTTACFTENFKIYLDIMRSTFPDYGIGLSIIALNLINMYSESDSPIWIDFSVVDSCVDFYVVNLLDLNYCEDELKVGGTTPINGSAPYTIEKAKSYFTQLGIPKEKTYFMYPILAKLMGTTDAVCNMTNSKMCTCPNADDICVENTQSLIDKGVYANLNGVGFIVTDVDLYDDPYDCCKCGTPYPAFHRVLAGFNGEPAPPVCPSFDKK